MSYFWSLSKRPTHSNNILSKAHVSIYKSIFYPTLKQDLSFCNLYTIASKFFLVVSEVSKAGDFYHWPFFFCLIRLKDFATDY